MKVELSKFIGEIWQYKPVIIILVGGGLLIFIFSVVDTHRHRKKIHKKRNRTKHH